MLTRTLELQGKTFVSGHILAEKYGVTYTTIRRWTERKLLPRPIKLCNRCYYDVEKVEASMVRGE